jgi:hypothetical protein
MLNLVCISLLRLCCRNPNAATLYDACVNEEGKMLIITGLLINNLSELIAGGQTIGMAGAHSSHTGGTVVQAAMTLNSVVHGHGS